MVRSLWRSELDGPIAPATQFGIGPGGVAGAIGLASDGTGGFLVVGRVFGDLGGPSAGGYDAFFARHDNQGIQLWIKQFGTAEWDAATAVTADGSGGAYVVGYLESLSGDGDVYVGRYDGDGNELWYDRFGDRNWMDQAWAVVSDGAGGRVRRRNHTR